MKEILELYKQKKGEIKNRLIDFRKLNEDEYIKELTFCLLTPQSNAQKCWEAVQALNKIELKEENKEAISLILKTRTRFHNNKTNYLIEAKKNWNNIKGKLNSNNTLETRNWLADNIKGMGYKEASHFLRNIGKSNNKLAILDRHILRNLKTMGVIDEDRIKNTKDYFEIEKKFISFSNKIGIPIDELDLLFWSKENGQIFK